MPADSAETLIEHLSRFRGIDRPAVQVANMVLSYAELTEQVAATAARLCEIGVEPRDRVLIILPNSIEHIIGVLAVIAAGAVAIPVDIDAGSSRLDDIVAQTGPRCCLVDPDRGAVSGMQTISLHINPNSKAIECVSHGSAPVAAQTDSLQATVAFIRFTSGSTGHAKGVMLTHAQQLWIARALSEYFGLDSDHRELVLVSMALSGGWQRVAATLYAGGRVIIAEKPLSVGDLLDTMVSTGATGFFTPPPLVRMMLASPGDRASRALRACRTIETGSAAITSGELQTLKALVPDARVYFHYGLTECSRAVILDTCSHADHMATVGRPLPGVEIKIVDEKFNALPCNQDGQILLRGPQLTIGYWRQPELNRQRFVDGWLATGDYGLIDEAGFLTLRGRHDDMINCGGHCYFPGEVEHALGTPGDVEQYLVAGVPDPRGVLQDIPWAFVVPCRPDDWSPKNFLARARDRLPAHMVPRQVVTIPALPLTPSGKPDRRETVKLYGGNT